MCLFPLCRPSSRLNFEIVVVEDSSPDGTLAVAQMLQVMLPPCHRTNLARRAGIFSCCRYRSHRRVFVRLFGKSTPLLHTSF